MINLFANALNPAIDSNLPNDVLVVLALAKLERLVDWFRTIGDDILQLQRAKVCPLRLNNSQCHAWWDISVRLIYRRWLALVLVHHRFAPKSVFLKEWRSLVGVALAECFVNLVVFLIHWRRLRLRLLNTLSVRIGLVVLVGALDRLRLCWWLAIRRLRWRLGIGRLSWSRHAIRRRSLLVARWWLIVLLLKLAALVVLVIRLLV